MKILILKFKGYVKDEYKDRLIDKITKQMQNTGLIVIDESMDYEVVDIDPEYQKMYSKLTD